METTVVIAGCVLALAVLPCALLVLSWLQWRKSKLRFHVLLAVNCMLSLIVAAWLLTGFENEWGRFDQQRMQAWIWLSPISIALAAMSLLACCAAKRTFRLPAFYASLLFLAI